MKVPRPLGHQEHSEMVGKLLSFDYLYIGESADDKEYILILKDNFSGCVFLRTCVHANAETTTEVLLEYFSTFIRVLRWFSDQVTHFRNAVMELPANSMGANHRFSTAYVPWSNKTAESACKEILRAMKASSSDFKTLEAEWTKTVPEIQITTKKSPSRGLGNRASIIFHTGMIPGIQLQVAITSLNCKPSISIEKVMYIQVLNVEELHNHLHQMHKEVQEVLQEAPKKAVTRHNSKTHVRPCNIAVGDYVVVDRSQGRCLQIG